jgi:hypothetical protein
MAHMRPFEAHVRAKGKDWPLVGYSMIGRRRMDNLQACVETVIKDGIPGDLIETGVWRGGAVMLMKAILKAHGVTDRTLWIADSFAGLPKPDSASDGTDYSENKFLAVSRRRVQANFERFGLMDGERQISRGLVQRHAARRPDRAAGDPQARWRPVLLHDGCPDGPLSEGEQGRIRHRRRLPRLAGMQAGHPGISSGPRRVPGDPVHRRGRGLLARDLTMQGQKTILFDGRLAADFQFALAIARRPPGPFLVRQAIGDEVAHRAKRDAQYEFS